MTAEINGEALNNTREKFGVEAGVSSFSLRDLVWKLYLFEKIFLRNPRFNYRTYFKVADRRRCRNKPERVYLQIFGHQMLRETYAVCRDLATRPFLLFGSLLGHYREGGFIDTDTDIDLGLLEDDYSRVDDLKRRMREEGYIVNAESGYGVKFRKPRRYRRLTVEFYRVYEEGGRMVCPVGITESLGMCYYPPNIFADLVETKFSESVDVLVPERAEEYLELTYGDWKTPKADFDVSCDYANVER